MGLFGAFRSSTLCGDRADICDGELVTTFGTMRGRSVSLGFGRFSGSETRVGSERLIDSLFLRDVTRNNWLDGLGEFGEISMQGVGLFMYISVLRWYGFRIYVFDWFFRLKI